MQVNKLLGPGLILLTFLTGCVDPYQPEIHEIAEMLVISGRITDQPGIHYVEVSKSSPFNEPEYVPVKKCTVVISDDQNNSIPLTEKKAGRYEADIPAGFLAIGNRYRVDVLTPDGKQYQSDYEAILPCPPIDSIYYKVETKETETPGAPIYGVQFFLDTDASGSYAKNYRWEITETWEYHSHYYLNDFYDGQINFRLDDADSLYYCWKSNTLDDIYTFTTKSLSGNKINHCPLNFVSNETDRLSVRYSVLVSQYSLSDSAYNYWNTLQNQSQGTGGFYETQPASISGNIHCLTHPDEIVLGYFTASAVTEKRAFTKGFFSFPISAPYCDREYYSDDELNEVLRSFRKSDYPVFVLNLSRTVEGPWDYVSQDCFDCRQRGGSLIKPDFWE